MHYSKKVQTLVYLFSLVHVSRLRYGGNRRTNVFQTTCLLYKEREKFCIVIDVYYQKIRPMNDVYGSHFEVGYVYVGMVAG